MSETPMHPPKSDADVEWFAAHVVSDELTLDRIRSAHSRLPWLSRMEDIYNQGHQEGCYMCWLITRIEEAKG